MNAHSPRGGRSDLDAIDAYRRAVAVAREAEDLAMLGRLSGEELEKLRVDALDCILEIARHGPPISAES